MFAPQRSQSGPGLSINTGAANSLPPTSNAPPASGGLFGSKPAGSMFGSTASVAPSAGTLFSTAATTSAGSSSLFGATANAPSQAGTLFGGSAANAQPAQSTSLFGSTATAQPQQQTSSLFGNTASQPQQQSTSIFGSTPAQPQQTTSLFGNTTQQQPATTSLFGNTQAQPQSTSLFGGLNKPAATAFGQPAAGGSLFGATQQQAQQPGSLFGGATQQQQQGTSLFGNTQGGNLFGANQSKSLFGISQNTQGGLQQSTLNPAQRTQRSIFSNSIGAYTAEQQAVPGVRINLTELRPTTRFNDLYEGIQKEIEAIDTAIYNQMKLAEECESIMPHNASTISSIPPDVDLCARKLDALERSLESDAASIDDAKNLARKDAEAARLSFRAISSLRMPAHLQSSSNFPRGIANLGSDDATSSRDLLSYFGTHTDDMSQKLDIMKRQLGEVESFLSSTEAQQIAQIQSTRLSHGRDGGVKSAEDQIKEMAAVLQSFEGGILNVATRVTATRESLGGLIVGETNGRGRR